MPVNGSCRLHLANGATEACPGAECAFWEPGGAVVDPRCFVDRVGFEVEARPELARWLLALRDQLDHAREPTVD